MQTACVIVAEWDVNMKKNGIKKGTMRIAVCGIIAALSLVFMMMTSLFQSEHTLCPVLQEFSFPA